MDVVDVIKFLVAVGITIYAFLSYMQLRGGYMSKPFVAFTIAGAFFVLASILDLSGFEEIHDIAGVISLSTLLAGFVVLYRTWTKFAQ